MDDNKRVQLPTIPKKDEVRIGSEEFESLKDTLDKLVEELSAVESMKEMFNQVIDEDASRDEQFKKDFIQYFTIFKDRVDKLLVKTSEEFNYVGFLQEKIRNGELSKQVNLLEQQLEIEKAEISKQLQRVDGCVEKIESYLERESSVFEEKIKHLQQSVDERIESLEKIVESLEEKVKGYNDIDGKLEKSLEEFQRSNNEKVSETVSSVTAFTKCQTEGAVGSLTKISQKTFSEIKEKTIDFMKQCKEMSEKEAAKAAKHMMNQGRFDRKDKIIIVMCAIIIINELFTMLPSIIGNIAR